MSVRTVRTNAELRELTSKYLLVLLAAFASGIEGIDVDFDSLAYMGDDYANKVVFAKFFTEEAPELDQDLEPIDIATLYTIKDGFRRDMVAGKIQGAWEAIVGEAIQNLEDMEN
ncbi:unnamed protein product [Fusarium equiseti]|uniref:Uncharacterized protein n=1 Tax=Fusarium equiseti TaxID=61235 RepID=A0A8J2IGR4_FUSEQ|nr:unnamed protein product [Fusarium equiseti]